MATVLTLWLGLGTVLLAAGAEDELKFATVLAFVQNAHWAEQLAHGGSLTVGVVGRAEFARGLSAGAAGKTVNGHPLRVLSLGTPVDPHCCQVLYFATDRTSEIKPALQTFSSAHVLTIGECDDFLDLGGAVNLFIQDGHMAFEVSLATLTRAGIEIGSKLLRFGQIRDLRNARPAK
ncbi:MAG: YfiR family protein [Ignavibacteriota bacterium]